MKPVGLYLRTRYNTLYVQVSWYERGRLCNTQYSTAKYGPLMATKLAMSHRRDLRQEYTPQRAWRALKEAA